MRVPAQGFMEVSALKYSGGIGLHGRSPLLRLQSDDRLVALVRRGSTPAFEALVSRYESRLLAFCRHLLGSREDAEDVLQEVLAAAFNAMLADERPINVRPWLYRIARNRSLNHLRRIQAVAVDSMDFHYSDNGASTADKVHDREEFRLLVGDIHELPETQKTALVLREMDALSYEQIAEAMETTVPSVKSLLVRARVSLAEAAEARLLSCEEVRIELGEMAEGLRRRPTPLVRRHLRTCDRCSAFKLQLRDTNRALAAVLPVGLLAVVRRFLLTHVGHSASSSATASGAGATAAGTTLVGGSGAGGVVTAGLGALATKAAAGLAAAALVTAGAIDVEHSTGQVHHRPYSLLGSSAGVAALAGGGTAVAGTTHQRHVKAGQSKSHKKTTTKKQTATTATTTTPTTKTTTTPKTTTAPKATPKHHQKAGGRTQVQTIPTVLTPTGTTTTTTPTTPQPDKQSKKRR